MTSLYSEATSFIGALNLTNAREHLEMSLTFAKLEDETKIDQFKCTDLLKIDVSGLGLLLTQCERFGSNTSMHTTRLIMAVLIENDENISIHNKNDNDNSNNSNNNNNKNKLDLSFVNILAEFIESFLIFKHEQDNKLDFVPHIQVIDIINRCLESTTKALKTSIGHKLSTLVLEKIVTNKQKCSYFNQIAPEILLKLLKNIEEEFNMCSGSNSNSSSFVDSSYNRSTYGMNIEDIVKRYFRFLFDNDAIELSFKSSNTHTTPITLEHTLNDVTDYVEEDVDVSSDTPVVSPVNMADIIWDTIVALVLGSKNKATANTTSNNSGLRYRVGSTLLCIFLESFNSQAQQSNANLQSHQLVFASNSSSPTRRRNTTSSIKRVYKMQLFWDLVLELMQSTDKLVLKRTAYCIQMASDTLGLGENKNNITATKSNKKDKKDKKDNKNISSNSTVATTTAGVIGDGAWVPVWLACFQQIDDKAGAIHLMKQVIPLLQYLCEQSSYHEGLSMALEKVNAIKVRERMRAGIDKNGGYNDDDDDLTVDIDVGVEIDEKYAAVLSPSFKLPLPLLSFGWIRRLLELMLSPPLPSLRKGALKLILDGTLTLPMTTESLQWMATGLLHFAGNKIFYPKATDTLRYMSKRNDVLYSYVDKLQLHQTSNSQRIAKMLSTASATSTTATTTNTKDDDNSSSKIKYRPEQLESRILESGLPFRKRSEYLRRVLQQTQQDGPIFGKQDIDNYPGLLLPSFLATVICRLAESIDKDENHYDTLNDSSNSCDEVETDKRKKFILDLITSLENSSWGSNGSENGVQCLSFGGLIWVLSTFNIRGLHLVLPRSLSSDRIASFSRRMLSTGSAMDCASVLLRRAAYAGFIPLIMYCSDISGYNYSSSNDMSINNCNNILSKKDEEDTHSSSNLFGLVSVFTALCTYTNNNGLAYTLEGIIVPGKNTSASAVETNAEEGLGLVSKYQDREFTALALTRTLAECIHLHGRGLVIKALQSRESAVYLSLIQSLVMILMDGTNDTTNTASSSSNGDNNNNYEVDNGNSDVRDEKSDALEAINVTGGSATVTMVMEVVSEAIYGSIQCFESLYTNPYLNRDAQSYGLYFLEGVANVFFCYDSCHQPLLTLAPSLCAAVMEHATDLLGFLQVMVLSAVAEGASIDGAGMVRGRMLVYLEEESRRHRAAIKAFCGVLLIMLTTNANTIAINSSNSSNHNDYVVLKQKISRYQQLQASTVLGLGTKLANELLSIVLRCSNAASAMFSSGTSDVSHTDTDNNNFLSGCEGLVAMESLVQLLVAMHKCVYQQAISQLSPITATTTTTTITTDSTSHMYSNTINNTNTGSIATATIERTDVLGLYSCVLHIFNALIKLDGPTSSSPGFAKVGGISQSELQLYAPSTSTSYTTSFANGNTVDIGSSGEVATHMINNIGTFSKISSAYSEWKWRSLRAAMATLVMLGEGSIGGDMIHGDSIVLLKIDGIQLMRDMELNSNYDGPGDVSIQTLQVLTNTLEVCAQGAITSVLQLAVTAMRQVLLVYYTDSQAHTDADTRTISPHIPKKILTKIKNLFKAAWNVCYPGSRQQLDFNLIAGYVRLVLDGSVLAAAAGLPPVHSVHARHLNKTTTSATSATDTTETCNNFSQSSYLHTPTTDTAADGTNNEIHKLLLECFDELYVLAIDRAHLMQFIACHLCVEWENDARLVMPLLTRITKLLLHGEGIDANSAANAINVEDLNMSRTSISKLSVNMSYAHSLSIENDEQRFLKYSNKSVRLIVLTFLERVALQIQAHNKSNTIHTSEYFTCVYNWMRRLIHHLLYLNATPEMKEVVTFGHTIYRLKLRLWQALCVLSIAIDGDAVHKSEGDESTDASVSTFHSMISFNFDEGKDMTEQREQLLALAPIGTPAAAKREALFFWEASGLGKRGTVINRTTRSDDRKEFKWKENDTLSDINDDMSTATGNNINNTAASNANANANKKSTLGGRPSFGGKKFDASLPIESTRASIDVDITTPPAGFAALTMEGLSHQSIHSIRVHMEVFAARLIAVCRECMLPPILKELRVMEHPQQVLASYFVIIGHLWHMKDGQEELLLSDYRDYIGDSDGEETEVLLPISTALNSNNDSNHVKSVVPTTTTTTTTSVTEVSDNDSNSFTMGDHCAAQIVRILLPWMACGPGLPRATAQVVCTWLIPLVLDHDSNNRDITGQCKISSSTRGLLQSMLLLLQYNRELSRLCERQRKFLKKFNVSFMSSVKGMLTLTPEGSDLVCSHTLNEITAFLDEEMKERIAENLLLNSRIDSIENVNLNSATATATANQNNDVNGTALSRGVDELVLQTKITPFDELQLGFSEAEQSRRMNPVGRLKQSLIVCASLLDKPTNLGGLTRTCEIFAVDKLIIPDVRVCKHDMFKALAVSADSHQTLEEVSEDHLMSWLKKMKADGYGIVALEQAESSVDLSQSDNLRIKEGHVGVFPSKAVLLLGKEKEGVPVEYLQEVDVTIEIPQFGVTRSLNVHVSAAIAIWEITKCSNLLN